MMEEGSIGDGWWNRTDEVFFNLTISVMIYMIGINT